MTDYSKISDFEINKAVAISQGFAPENCDIAKRGSSLVGVDWDEDTGSATKVFDYCNNPSDAWSIIADKKISVMWMTGEGQWCAWANGELEEGCWEWRYCPENYSHGDNPLRAAMIVYLMMKERENG